MAYEGYVDVVNNREISGWVYDDGNDDPLMVEILVGEKVHATVRADGFRPDLVAHGKGNGRHAFKYSLGGGATASVVLSARIQGKRWRIQPTASATGQPPPLHHDARRKLLHTLEYGYPQVATDFTAAAPSADEALIVGRLIEAFHRALKDDPDPRARKPDMWSEIQAAQHREVLELIRRRDAAGVAAYLRDAHAKGLTFGITQGSDMTTALRASPDARRSIATEYMDNLVSLAEFLGLLDVECPSQRGRWGENLHSDPKALADRVAAETGIPIELPAVIGSYFGIATRSGVITGRDLCALYAVLQLKKLAGDRGIAKPRVCEIGGGLGAAAYYASRLGMAYTVIDLPLVGVLQGYFLLRALPEVDIQLYGEQESAATAIRLLPAFSFGLPGREYDLLFNQDGFPAMNEAYGLAYLTHAAENVRHAFYSINQEGRAPQAGEVPQATVADLVVKAGGFERTQRHRHWLKAGYVEEVYRKRSL